MEYEGSEYIDINEIVSYMSRFTAAVSKSMAYGTRRFNAAFIKASNIPILSRMNPIARIDTYFFKIHSNIVLPSTP